MATVSAFYGVDSFAVDLNFYSRHFYEDAFYDNVGYILGGRRYADVYLVNGYDGLNDLVIGFGGTGLGFNELGQANRGTITGIVTSFYDGPDISLLQDVSVSAAALARVATTVSNTDDRALVSMMLSGADLFNLSQFDDRMEGWGGNDRMFGQAGNDTLIGGAGNDTLAGGTGHDRLVGGTGNDRMVGSLGADRLEGGSGADIFEGGAGRDMMFAGHDISRDVFVFRALSDSAPGALRDQIFQFRSGQDDIDLSLIDAHAGRAGNQAFSFTGTSAAAHSVWTVRTADGVLVRADVNGNRVHDVEIFVDDVFRLGLADLVL